MTSRVCRPPVTVRRASRLVRALVALACLFATAAHAQSDESAQLRALRSCARETCQVALERGTLQGTVLRVGADRTIPVGLTGGNVMKHLAVVPAAGIEAGKARSLLQQRAFLSVATIAGVIAVATVGWHDSPYYGSTKEYSAPGVSLRVVAALAVSGGGIYLAGRRARQAVPHFEEAVRLYNQQLPP